MCVVLATEKVVFVLRLFDFAQDSARTDNLQHLCLGPLPFALSLPKGERAEFLQNS
jgi:hypothetical protein